MYIIINDDVETSPKQSSLFWENSV